MRTILIILTVLVAANLPTFAHVDRIEQPRTLTVGFQNRESITFSLSNTVVTAMSVRMGKKTYTIPHAECAKFRNIRFETVRMLSNGQDNFAANASYFYVQCEMGSESERRFGELPIIQIMFRSGKFELSKIIRKTGDDTWSHEPF